MGSASAGLARKVREFLGGRHRLQASSLNSAIQYLRGPTDYTNQRNIYRLYKTSVLLIQPPSAWRIQSLKCSLYTWASRSNDAKPWNAMPRTPDAKLMLIAVSKLTAPQQHYCVEDVRNMHLPANFCMHKNVAPERCKDDEGAPNDKRNEECERQEDIETK